MLLRLDEVQEDRVYRLKAMSRKIARRSGERLLNKLLHD
jgi:hypothetical protein